MLPPAVGLRTHVWNSLWRSALLLAGFPVLLLLLGFALALLLAAGDAPDLGAGFRRALALMPAVVPVVLAVTAIWFAIAWAANQRILDGLTGARRVTRREEPLLWNLTETLCISRGLGMPRLAVIEAPERNAFASGLSRRTGAITVTRGLIEGLEAGELRAVLAHELTHIRNGDARLAVIAAVFAGVISLPGEMLVRGGRWIRIGGRRGAGGGSSSGSGRRREDGAAALMVVIALVVMVLAYLLAIGLRFALSRNREFIADAGAVELTQDPDAMIAALRKVSGHSAMPRLPSQVQAMLLDSPEETLGNAWLATHPPLEERIAALVRFAGGRDPGPAPAPPATAPPAPAQPAPAPAAEAAWGHAASGAPPPGAAATPWWRGR